MMVFMPVISTFAISELLTINNIKLFGTTLQENIYNGMWNYGAALSLVMLLLISIVSLLNNQGSARQAEEGGLILMKRIFASSYLGILLLMLYAPILIIIIFSFTEAKVLGNWTGFSFKLYTSLFHGGVQHSLTSALWNTLIIGLIAAFASTLLGTMAAIGIYNLSARAQKAVHMVNSIPILNPDIITAISLFLLFVGLAYRRAIQR